MDNSNNSNSDIAWRIILYLGYCILFVNSFVKLETKKPLAFLEPMGSKSS
jgi:hypothetical protein